MQSLKSDTVTTSSYTEDGRATLNTVYSAPASVTHIPSDIAKTSFASLGRKLTCSAMLLIADLIAIALSTGALMLAFNLQTNSVEIFTYAAISCLFLLSAAAKGHYSRRTPFWDQIRELIKMTVFFSVAHGAATSIFSSSQNSLIHMGVWALAFINIVLVRSLTKEILLRLGLWRIPTVIIGDGRNAIETAYALLSERHLGYDLISFLSPSAASKSEIMIGDRKVPVRHIDERSKKVLRRLGSPYVVIALERGGIDKLQNQIDRLIQDTPNIAVAPALRGLPLFGAHPYHFFSHEVMLLEIKNNLSKLTSRTVKRVFDIVAASILLVLLSPAFLLIGYLVRKTGKSIFFAHERVGHRGKTFRCFKFRSMVENSREVLDELLANSDDARREWYRDFKLKCDPRITRIGGFLRRSSLDELPQLWNVIKGDMSLVGPRPVIQDEIPYYGNYVNFYYRSRPGLTGLWQVSGRNDIDYDSRVQLDVWYVSNWSLWNDIVILLRTVTVVLNKSGAY